MRASLYRFIVAAAAVVAAGCLGDLPAGTPKQPAAPNKADASNPHPVHVDAVHQQSDADGGAPESQPDLAPAAQPDLAPVSTDLAGLVNCYGVSYCDRATMFCLRYFNGTPGKPGTLKVPPSCFAPNDPCAGGTLDCACIQADPTLGPACLQCFDNQDGTFTCYSG